MMQHAGIERPRLRQDLFAEAVDEHGARFIDVMDPDRGSIFRFYEVEFSIACAMDGERDVPGIVRWAQEELGLTASAHEVRAVIDTLGELGYLDQTAGARAAAADHVAVDTTADVPAEVVNVAPPVAVELDVEPVVQHSEVSIDLSDHIAVGPADVQEAVRQSRVMAAVEAPPGFEAPVTMQPPVAAEPPVSRPPTPEPVAPEPVVARPPEPVAVTRPPTPEPIVVTRPPTPEPVAPEPVAVTPEPPIARPRPQTPPTGEPVIARPDGRKPPVDLPKVPEQQPVAEKQPAPPVGGRRTSPVLIVLLILVVLGAAGFFVWKYVLDKSNGPASTTGAAPVAPQPPPAPPPPPPKAVATAKIELSTGRPKTILGFFPGTIEWIEKTGKVAKSGDVIMKLVGARPLEAQVAALQKDVDKRQADLQAVYKTRDAAQAAGDDAAMKKAQAKIDDLEKVYNAKTEQLNAKVDQLEPFLVRLIVDGTLTITRKVGDKIPENTPIATILQPPAPMVTFKVPVDLKLETGTAVAVKLGEKLVTCTVADWEPEKLSMTCPEEPGVVEGAVVNWELP